MDSAPPPGVKYLLEAGPGDAGFRLSLRHRLAGGGFTDVLGELLSWTPEQVQIRTREGTVALIDTALVVAARRIPPAPARRTR